SNHRVQVFTPEGKYLFQFGSFGTGDGQFELAAEIEIADDGSVYVREEDSTRPLTKWTANGKFVWRSPDRGTDPDLQHALYGPVVRADGSVLMSCEQGADAFVVFDPADGHITSRWDNAELPWGAELSLDGQGDIYGLEFNTSALKIFDSTGNLIGADYPAV